MSNEGFNDAAVKKGLSNKDICAIAISLVLALIAGILLCFLQNIWKSILFTLMFVFIGNAIRNLINILAQHPKFSYKYMIPLLLLALGYLLGGIYGLPFHYEYPDPNGWVATFNGEKTDPVRNVFGEGINLFTDNDYNHLSYSQHCWVSENENRFLKYRYFLNPHGNYISWVGFFTDFSHPPPLAYSISNYRKISLRLRSTSKLIDDSVHVLIILPAKEGISSGGEYAYFEYEIPAYDITPNWKTFIVGFNQFNLPSRSSKKDLKFDLKSVFRFQIAIKGPPNKNVKGYIDIDDIRFER